jgi:hypothetical protein
LFNWADFSDSPKTNGRWRKALFDSEAPLRYDRPATEIERFSFESIAADQSAIQTHLFWRKNCLKFKEMVNWSSEKVSNPDQFWSPITHWFVSPEAREELPFEDSVKMWCWMISTVAKIEQSLHTPLQYPTIWVEIEEKCTSVWFVEMHSPTSRNFLKIVTVSVLTRKVGILDDWWERIDPVIWDVQR